MKRVLFFLSVIMFFWSCLTGQNGINNNDQPRVPLGPDGFSIVGKWISENKSEADQYIIFRENAYAVMGSNQIEFKGTFTINYDIKPFELDMDLKDAGKIETIFRIIDNDTIEFAGTEPDVQRPKDFSNVSVILVRAQ